MRYPVKGGYTALQNELVRNADIEYNKRVIGIDPTKKTVSFDDGSVYCYDRLISSIPLPELTHLVAETPDTN